MIQPTFLLISCMTFPLRSNQHSAKAQFSNTSSDCKIFGKEIRHLKNSPSDYFGFRQNYEVPTVETEKLTDDIIELVPFVILQRHNHIRQVYNLPLLRLSVKLNELCKIYAQKHASGEIGLMADYPLQYGLNVYYGERACSNPNFVMEIWSNELVLYNVTDSNENNIRNMPHLHQILWEDTQALGVHITTMEYTPTETFLLYILYDPTGDAPEEFKKNFPILNAYNLGIIFRSKPFIVLLHLYLLYRF